MEPLSPLHAKDVGRLDLRSRHRLFSRGCRRQGICFRPNRRQMYLDQMKCHKLLRSVLWREPTIPLFEVPTCLTKFGRKYIIFKYYNYNTLNLELMIAKTVMLCPIRTSCVFVCCAFRLFKLTTTRPCTCCSTLSNAQMDIASTSVCHNHNMIENVNGGECFGLFYLH